MKKITSLVLALVMLMSMCATAFAIDYPDADTEIETDGYYPGDDYVEPEPDENPDVVWNYTGADEDANQLDEELPLVTKFSDVKSSNWFYSDVMECAKLGIVAGFADGTFKPNDNVTYAQFIVMMTRTFYNDKIEKVTDTAGKPWYYANMQVARDRQLDFKTNIKNQGGWPKVACADSAINRYEMAMVIHSTLVDNDKSATAAQKDAAKASITDFAKIPKLDAKQAYIVAVPNCYATGIITGMSDGSFSGTSNMTRAQACTVMVRMLKLIKNYNPGDKDNNQYDDGKNQDTGNNNQNNSTKKLANGKDITTDNVIAILDEIRREYPTGTVWTNKSVNPNTKYYAAGNSSTDVKAVMRQFKYNGGTASTQYACSGWAAMVSDRIFGQTGFPAREVTDGSKIRPGDIVMALKSDGTLGHVSIVTDNSFQTTGLSGAKYWSFHTVSGNADGGYVVWPDENSWFTLGGSTSARIFTRYPD